MRGHGIACVLGMPTSRPVRRHVPTLEASTAARFQGTPVRRCKEFYDSASTRSRVRRIVARVEAGDQGTDTRFVLTNLRHGSGR